MQRGRDSSLKSTSKALYWEDYFDIAPLIKAFLDRRPNDTIFEDDQLLTDYVLALPNFEDSRLKPDNPEILQRLRWLLRDLESDEDAFFAVGDEEGVSW